MSDDELEDFFFHDILNYIIYIIPYHTKYCFYEEIKYNGTMKYQAEVMSEYSENLKLKIKLPDSSDIHSFFIHEMDDDDHIFHIKSPGTLEYCFDNTNSREDVSVWFYMILPSKNDIPITHKALSSARQMGSKFREMTNSIYRWSHQTLRHSVHIQKRKKSVINSSFFICLVILFTGVLQVILIRALFKKYR